MHRALVALVALLAVTALWACGGSTATRSDAGTDGASSPDSAFDASGIPLQHRPSDAACTQPPPAAGCPFPGGTCTTDADCTSDAATNGRCIEPSINSCTCTYDACAGDADCPTGQTCACHGAPYLGSAGNGCLPGNCRVDTDCEAGKGYCSPSPSAQCGTGTGPGLVGYYCHTAKDLCINDADCPVLRNPSDPNDVTSQTCSYSAPAGRWQCQPAPICGG
jgi:hypothetical protein